MYSHATHRAIMQQCQGLEILENLRTQQPISGSYEGIIPGERRLAQFFIFNFLIIAIYSSQ